MKKQAGIATLAIAVILLLVTTLSALYLNRSAVFDMKTSANQYRQTQAFEMASRGLERGIAWLQMRASVDEDTYTNCSVVPQPFTKAVWGAKTGQTVVQAAADPYEYMVLTDACNSGSPTISNVSIGDASYNVDVLFRRKKGSVADLFRIEVIANSSTVDYAMSSDPYKARAIVAQIILLRQQETNPAPVNPNAPLLVQAGVSSVTGTPDICPLNPTDPNINQGNRDDCSAGNGGTVGTAIATMQPTATGFITPGHFDLHGGAITPLNAPTLKVFDVLFPAMTEADIKSLSEYQYANKPIAERTVFYYGAGSSYGNPPNKLSAIGSAGSPVLVYVSASAYTGSNCPGFSPGQFFGVFYMGRDCDGNGWGNADIYGTLAVEGTLSKFSANTINRYNNIGDLLGNSGGVSPGQLTKVPGGWRDFKHQGE